MTSRFNPQRLAVARQKRRMTKAKLAAAADLSTKSVTSYESGLTEPTADSVAVLASVLAFPKLFFYLPDMEMPEVYGVSFRALSTLTASQRDSALAAGALAIELSHWIERQFVLPQVQVPDMRGMDPEAAASMIRQHWGLGESPVTNAIHLLESRGVRVFSLAEDTREIDAYSFWRNDVPFIFLNTMKSSERSRHDAMHELGHLTLHRHHGMAYGREAEMEAEAFASAMLMPRADITARAPRNPTLARLIQFKKRWNVSVASVAHRLHALDLITEWNYRTLCVQIAEQGFRTNEPDSLPRETSQVLQKVFALWRKDGMSRAAIATELGLYRRDLEALVFGLVLTDAGGNGSASPNPSPQPRTVQLRLVD